jgi:hypothetical protein
MKRNTTLNNRFLIIIYLYHKEIYSFFNKKTRDNDMTSYVMCRPLWFIQDLIIIILDINWRLFKIRSTILMSGKKHWPDFFKHPPSLLHCPSYATRGSSLFSPINCCPLLPFLCSVFSGFDFIFHSQLLIAPLLRINWLFWLIITIPCFPLFLLGYGTPFVFSSMFVALTIISCTLYAPPALSILFPPNYSLQLN